MTESICFEADEDRYEELAYLAKQLGADEDDLWNEALDLLLSAYRLRENDVEPGGLLSDLHGVQGRIRAMIRELEFIRITTAEADSLLNEMGLDVPAVAGLGRHYRALFESSERALKAAGIGPFFKEISSPVAAVLKMPSKQQSEGISRNSRVIKPSASSSDGERPAR